MRTALVRSTTSLALVALSALALPAQAPVQRPTAASSGDPSLLVQPAQSSLVLARDGSLIGEIGREWRTSVPLRSLPAYVGQAFVAIEDQRFYQHDGVDLIGIAGALRDAVGGDARGASTITQQLVGNMHPDVVDRTDRTLGRKLREQQAARAMEKRYTKAQILEAYINFIHYGRGWFGIESASRHYFGKPAASLTLAEAATLAALPKSPTNYDPGRNPERARQRRNLVLTVMAQQKYISAEQARAAQAEPVITVPDGGMSAPSLYFVDAVRQQAERAGIRVNEGGFRIHTSLDPVLQRAAVKALLDGTAALENRPGYRHLRYADRAGKGNDYLQGAVVALDAFSGEVRAMVGGRNHVEAPFNRAVTAVRQPGSAFKPVVYAAAVASGITASDTVADTALAVPLENGRVYRPGNADGRFLGSMALREALVQSRNPVAVDLALRVGLDSVAALAARMGLTTPVSPVPSSAIGASGVRPLDLAALYAPFANGGLAVEPRLVTRVDDARGRTVWGGTGGSGRPVLDPAVAFIVRSMMTDVVQRGTATAVARALGDRVPAAGKTGTTNDNTDVWFVGVTPDLVGAVWLGFDQPRSIAPGAAGGTLAAPIWASMMSRFYEGRSPARTWTVPEGVVTVSLDRATGLAATDSTPAQQRMTEYYVRGTEPGAIRVDPWSLFKLGPLGM